MPRTMTAMQGIAPPGRALAACFFFPAGLSFAIDRMRADDALWRKRSRNG
jgi:hypothetical protein